MQSCDVVWRVRDAVRQETEWRTCEARCCTTLATPRVMRSTDAYVRQRRSDTSAYSSRVDRRISFRRRTCKLVASHVDSPPRPSSHALGACSCFFELGIPIFSKCNDHGCAGRISVINKGVSGNAPIAVGPSRSFEGTRPRTRFNDTVFRSEFLDCR